MNEYTGLKGTLFHAYDQAYRNDVNPETLKMVEQQDREAGITGLRVRFDLSAEQRVELGLGYAAYAHVPTDLYDKFKQILDLSAEQEVSVDVAVKETTQGKVAIVQDGKLLP